MTATPPSTEPRRALPVLTSLRFFAAAVVVFHHQAPDISLPFLDALTRSGYNAVTFFFVLSGFILTYVYSGPTERQPMARPAGEFWWARFLRIAPAYYLGLLLLTPRLLYTTLASKITSIEALLTALFVVPLFQQTMWPGAALLWNAPAWSLSVEFFFYLLFPVLAVISARIPRLWFLAVAGLLVVAMAVLRFQVLPSPADEGAYHDYFWFSPLVHLPQFIFGMALGRLFLFGRALPRAVYSAMLYGGLLAIVLITGARLLGRVYDPVIVGLFGLVIFGGAGREAAGRLLTLPLLVLLGEASYSMYILHVPIGFWWEWTTAHLPMALPAWAGFAAYFVLTVVISVLFFLGVEQPLRRRFRNSPPWTWWKSPRGSGADQPLAAKRGAP